MALFSGKVGLQRLKEGAEAWLRLDPRGALVTNRGGATFQEAVRNGNVYTCSTAAGGVSTGTAIGTTMSFCLYNPVGSGANLVVWRASMGFISATALGAGTVHYVAPTAGNATAVTGTAIVPVNCLLNKPGAGLALPKTTATVPASPLILRPFCSILDVTTTTAVPPFMTVDSVDGEFVIMPGGYLGLHATNTGSNAPLVVFGMTYEEVPII